MIKKTPTLSVIKKSDNHPEVPSILEQVSTHLQKFKDDSTLTGAVLVLYQTSVEGTATSGYYIGLDSIELVVGVLETFKTELLLNT